MRKRGQSVLEYAIILAIIIGIIVAVGRGIFRNSLSNALNTASERIQHEAEKLAPPQE